MTTEPVRAGHEWLALREPADAVARSTDLVEKLGPHLPPDGGIVVHDLGAGTGSMARWLAPRLRGPQHWVLHDRDVELLDRAGAEPSPLTADGAPVVVETRAGDITELPVGGLADATLVTASALLDMLTADELARLVESCAQAGCPVLITLSVAGTVELRPADPLDAVLMEAFNVHQRRTTAAGELLGPDAVRLAADGFTRRGLEVLTRPSPWLLGDESEGLLREWLHGWLAAAVEQRPELGAAAQHYAERRMSAVASGGLAVVVHHVDLLALRP